MSVSNIRLGESEDMLVTGWRMHSQSRTLAGDITIAADAAPVQIFDNGGAARNVDLPTPVPDTTGKTFLIRNNGGGAFVITVRDQADSSVGTLAQNEWGIFTLVSGAWMQVAGGATV